jgi:CheY-like chemotaxis protein
VTVTTSASLPRPRVLLCEDEGLTIMMLRKALRTHGYTVVGEAATAREAIQIAASTPLDLILMDVNLQGHVDGIEAARQILADRFVPIVILTATVDQTQVQRAFEAGVSGYIGKPVTSHNLLPMLAAILSHVPVAQNVEEARLYFDLVGGAECRNATPPIPELPLP